MLHAGGAIYKGAIAFCDNPAGTTGDMVQRYLFRYYSMHVAAMQGRAPRALAMLRSSAVGVAPSSHEILSLPHFSAFCWLWALFLFSDTAVDRIPHFLIFDSRQAGSANFSRCRAIARSRLPSATRGAVQVFVRLFSYGKKRRPNGRQ